MKRHVRRRISKDKKDNKQHFLSLSSSLLLFSVWDCRRRIPLLVVVFNGFSTSVRIESVSSFIDFVHLYLSASLSRESLRSCDHRVQSNSFAFVRTLFSSFRMSRLSSILSRKHSTPSSRHRSLRTQTIRLLAGLRNSSQSTSTRIDQQMGSRLRHQYSRSRLFSQRHDIDKHKDEGNNHEEDPSVDRSIRRRRIDGELWSSSTLSSIVDRSDLGEERRWTSSRSLVVDSSIARRWATTSSSFSRSSRSLQSSSSRTNLSSSTRSMVESIDVDSSQIPSNLSTRISNLQGKLSSSQNISNRLFSQSILSKIQFLINERFFKRRFRDRRNDRRNGDEGRGGGRLT